MGFGEFPSDAPPKRQWGESPEGASVPRILRQSRCASLPSGTRESESQTDQPSAEKRIACGLQSRATMAPEVGLGLPPVLRRALLRGNSSLLKPNSALLKRTLSMLFAHSFAHSFAGQRRRKAERGRCSTHDEAAQKIPRFDGCARSGGRLQKRSLAGGIEKGGASNSGVGIRKAIPRAQAPRPAKENPCEPHR